MSGLPVTEHAAAFPPRARRRSRWTVLLTVGAALLALATFARMMDFELRRDEQLYATPTALLEHHALYRDFFYNHVPGSAWLFRSLAVASGSDHLLLIARLGVFAGWLLLAGGLAWVALRLTRSAPVMAATVALALTNDILLGQAGMTATNNLLAPALGIVGTGLFMVAIKETQVSRLLVALSGLLLGLAAATKVSAIAFVIPVVAASLLLPGGLGLGRRLLEVVLPLALGGLVGGGGTLVALAANPDTFLADVVGFHIGPHRGYWLTHAQEEPAAISLAQRVQALVLALSTGSTVLAVFGVLYLTVLGLRAGARRILIHPPVLVAAASVTATLLMSLLPAPSFPQYFLPPLLGLPLLMAALASGLGEDPLAEAETAMRALCLCAVALASPRLAPDLRGLLRPSGWEVTRVHKVGVELAETLDQFGVSGKVATLAPIYPLEGGLDVYMAFATGPFAYRVSAFAGPERTRAYRSVSAEGVSAMFAADPPAALLLGFEPDLEAPMLAYAEAEHYQRVDDFRFEDRYGKAMLYIRPE